MAPPSSSAAASSGAATTAKNAASSSSLLSPQEQNARMVADRTFIRQLMQAALQGDASSLRSVATSYAAQHDDLSLPHVLSSCRDGQRRTVLHFACQSTTTTATTTKITTTNTNSTTADNNSYDDSSPNIVQVILQLVSPAEHDSSATEDVALHRRRLLRGKDKDGLTPLMLATQNPIFAEPFCTTLLQADAQLALARSNVGATALHYAAGSHYTTTTATSTTTSSSAPNVLRLLYHHGKVALETNSLRGGTPLHWAAAAAGSAISTKSSTKSKENEEEEDNETSTTITIFQTLFELGANVNARNDQGVTPLVVCMATGNDDASWYLIDASPTCDISLVLPDGNTLLHMAVHLNLTSTLTVLLERVHATKSSSSSLTHLLEAKNDQGQTPLDVACQEGHMECIRLLLTKPEEESASPGAVLKCFQAWTKKAKPLPPPPAVEPKAPAESAPSSDDHGTKKDDSLSPQEAEWKQQALQTLQTYSSSAKTEKEALSWKQQGNSAFGLKDWTKAVEYYSKAIELNPTEHTLYSNRSATYLALCSKDDASASSSSSTSSSPSEEQVAHYATLALQDAIWTTALRPEWPKSWYRLAMARLQHARFEDAAMAAWQGLQLDQSNTELQHLLRTCVERGRQHEQQQKEAAAALKKKKNKSDQGKDDATTS